VEVSQDADPKIMKGFSLAAGMLYILARHVEGWFYGSEILKQVQSVVAAEDGSLHSEQVLAAIAPTRQLLREQLRRQRQLFMPWVVAENS
jgi:aldehyde:ferredoxin oxidoreductase